MLYCQLLRQFRGMKQADVARHLGVHQVVISDIELGRRPTPKQLQALGRLFEFEPPEELLEPVDVEAVEKILIEELRRRKRGGKKGRVGEKRSRRTVRR